MARTDELLCTETRALLARLLDDELDPAERARVERHVDACPSCASELRSAERAFSALRALPAADHARLRDEALRELGLDAAPPRRGWTRAVRVVLTILAFLLLALYLRERRERVPDAPRGAETR